MTYIRDTLDNICKKYCDSCKTCPINHECKDRKIIREALERIMQVKDDY